jgi:hypothetical protein
LAGGWPTLRTWLSPFDFKLLTVWFYDDNPASWTWTQADSLFRFTISRPRGSIVPTNSLVVGDLVFADWDRNGQIDHTMLVTKVDSKKQVYVTYRSESHVDSTLADVSAREHAKVSSHTNPFYYGVQLNTIIN